MEHPRTIRVLVVDDSAFMRKTISAILNEADDLEVVATARDGLDAVKKVTDYRPDVITLDIEMPRLEGLQTLGYIMSECPTPVVMVSAYTESGAETTMKALEYGAVDFVCKPSGPISLDLDKVAQELVSKVRLAAQVDVTRLRFIEVERLQGSAGPTQSLVSGRQVVVIASSTGGPRALYDIIPLLPPDLPAALLVIQHMSQGFTKMLADRMDRISRIRIKEAEDGEPVLTGHAYFAPGNYHMLVESEAGREVIRLNQAPPRNSVRPSADVTLESVVKLYGANCLALILTGMGHDGTAGARLVKQAGGRVSVQDEATSVVFGMPRSVIDAGLADVVLPLDAITEHIVRQVQAGRASSNPK
jgi:two-component system, chemotaxis family, protein-glutamate methylesterase/glutaminase